MKARPDCLPCIFKQTLNTVREVSCDETTHLQALREVARYAATADFNCSPAAFSKPVYTSISRITGINDPYLQRKQESNRMALSLLPALRAMVSSSATPLETAIRIAAAGNIMDFGIGHDLPAETSLADITAMQLAINDTGDFTRELGPGRKLLYLGDNAGEIVFDTILVSEIIKTGTSVTFTVKSAPIINDATMPDAVDSGMTRLVPVIETGASDIGVNWNNVSAEFRHAFENADVILAKGHGNFETCDTRPENIYFLLRTKCRIVADALDAKLGDIVLKHKPAYPAETAGNTETCRDLPGTCHIQTHTT